MREVACPHCTFLNPPGRKKCTMCLKMLTTRSSPTSSEKKTQSPTTTQLSQSTTTQPNSRKRLRSSDRVGSPAGDDDIRNSDHVVSTAMTPPTNAPSQSRDTMATLFSTASGKPVTVSKVALATAARKFSDFDGAAGGVSHGDGGSESETNSSACERAGTPALVATLFSTAGGRPVKVNALNLERAQERFQLNEANPKHQDVANVPQATHTRNSERIHHDEANQAHVGSPGPAQVSTLFSTASGNAVKVSAASLAKARAKFDNQSSQETSENHSGDVTSEGEDASSSSSASPSPPPKPQARPAPILNAGKGPRRGFVPPQRIAPIPTVVASAVPQERSALISGAARAAHKGSDRLEPIVFREDVFGGCSSPSPLPAMADVPLGFLFPATCCGGKMREAMGIGGNRVKSGDNRIPTEAFHELMLTLGASRVHCTSTWCEQAVLSAMFQCLRVAHCTVPPTESAFTPAAVALCVSQKYNNEIVEGRRPVLRQMTEGDVPSMSLATVYVSEHCQERAAPHTNTIRVCDGCYHVKATLDIPLSNLLREGALPVGQRLAICGSKCLLPNPCSPWECLERVVLGLNYNGVRPVTDESPLGVAHAEPQPLPVALVHPMGGLVPVLRGVVSRVMPAFFVTSPPSHATTSGAPAGENNTLKIVRNWHAQLQHVDQLFQKAERASELNRGGSPSRSTFSVADADGPRVARVTSALIVDDSGNEALIQQWENCAEEASVAEPDAAAGPVEGSTICVYGLTPAKAFTAFAPFTSAKLFHASRQLHFTTVSRTCAPTRVIFTCLNDPEVSLTMGSAVDTVGLYLGSFDTDQGTFLLLLQEQDSYALVQIPLASPRSKLSFALPPTAGVPVVVEHAVFLSREDGDAGSDCARVFVKEYTRLVQRSVQPLLSKALLQAAGLAMVFTQHRQKYLTRKDAIFLNLQESLAAPGQSKAYEDAPPIGLLRSTMNTGVLLPDGLAGGSRGGATTARVPYYLRAAGSSGLDCGVKRGSGGVVLPDPKLPLPRSPAETTFTEQRVSATAHCFAARQPNAAASSYGNVLSLDLKWEDTSHGNRLIASVNLLGTEDDDTVLSPPKTATGTPGLTAALSVTWRYDVHPSCVQTAHIRIPAVVESLLEPCVGLQKICNVASDQKKVEGSLERHALLRQWRKDCSSSELWWKVLTHSTVNGSTDMDKEGDDGRMHWQPAEWATVKSLMRHSLESAFFRFNVNVATMELRSAHFITEDCNVSRLV